MDSGRDGEGRPVVKVAERVNERNAMATLVSLAKWTAQPNDNVVATLERLLALAKAGEIVNLAGGYVERDGSDCTFLCGGGHAAALVAAMTQATFRLVQQRSDAAQEPERPT